MQRRRDLFPLLRVLADRPGTPARFLILGSASPALIKEGSESLAGRVSFIDVTSFSLAELGGDALSRLWWRGGFPRAQLAPDDAATRQWLEDFRLEQILSVSGERNAYFWGTHSGAELDLLLHASRRLGFEFKYSEQPGATKSMRVALQDLELDHLYIVHPGQRRFPLDESITAITLPELIALLPSEIAGD